MKAILKPLALLAIFSAVACKKVQDPAQDTQANHTPTAPQLTELNEVTLTTVKGDTVFHALLKDSEIEIADTNYKLFDPQTGDYFFASANMKFAKQKVTASEPLAFVFNEGTVKADVVVYDHKGDTIYQTKNYRKIEYKSDYVVITEADKSTCASQKDKTVTLRPYVENKNGNVLR